MNKEEIQTGYLHVTVDEWNEMRNGGVQTKVKEIEEAKQEILTLLEEKVKGMKIMITDINGNKFEEGGNDTNYVLDEILSTIEELKK